MDFLISDTFTESLTKLSAQEQKAVKTTAFDLQLNPRQPSLRFHKLERAKDPHFWSVSVNLDIRLIVHWTDSSLLLCYVNHHDEAYDWANRRKIEKHPKTGAAQLVEIRETVEEVFVRQAGPESVKGSRKPLLFNRIQDDELLAYGIPVEWISYVKSIENEDELLDICDRLPQEAAEALLTIATGGKPKRPSVPAPTNPFAHPDAQRRFRVMSNVEELQQALDYPWEKWTVFLHPSQRSLVEKEYNGPTRICGSAGTGKTIVGIHRAVFLARQYPHAKLLHTTFSPALANALQIKLERLVGNELSVMKRIKVVAIRDIVYELYQKLPDQLTLVEPDKIREKLIDIQEKIDGKIRKQLLWDEWENVVDAWQLETWENYQDVIRLGRKTKLGVKQRQRLWQIFQELHNWLKESRLITWAGVFREVTKYQEATANYPFEFAIVDECQDLGIPELKFLATLGKNRPDSLFFTGDLGQRIFQQPFSWRALGIDIKGRSHTLTINYRTSHQIRSAADNLLPKSITDIDENTEPRNQTISVFNGPAPLVKVYDDLDTEIMAISQAITEYLAQGIQPEEIGVFVREEEQIERAIEAINLANVKVAKLSDKVSFVPGCIAVSTMHLAKGLEFRVAIIMACDDEVLPLQKRVESISDESDLEEVYNTERHLLYVACTRARDYLLVTGVNPASEFLDDLRV